MVWSPSTSGPTEHHGHPHWLEYLDHAGPILTKPIRIKEGHALLPDRPGSGLEWNEQLVERLLAA